MQVTVNGTPRAIQTPASLAEVVRALGLEGKRIAVERNGEIVPKSRYATTAIDAGDRLEIVGAVGGGWGGKKAQESAPPTLPATPSTLADPLVIAGRPYASRLLVGTGKYRDFEQTRAAIVASGAQIVTVAI